MPNHWVSTEIISCPESNNNGTLFFDSNTTWANKTGNNYVAWVWKAGDHDDNLPQINTEGTIDSIVSVNDAAGFSIVKYTGTGSNATIGHGLSNPPEIIFVKRLDTSADWVVGETVANDFTKVLFLNSTAASATATYFNSTDPTSTVFSVRGASAATGGAGNFIAYCWYSVSGHSNIGSYTATSGDDIINTGFRPRFIAIKNASSTGHWEVHDSRRYPTMDNENGLSKRLRFNDSSAEAQFNNTPVFFTDTGFTIDSSVTGDGYGDYDTTGQTYIYMAFK